MNSAIHLTQEFLARADAVRGRKRFPTPVVSDERHSFAVFGGRINRHKRKFAVYDPSGQALPNSDVISDEMRTFPEEDVDLNGSFTLVDKPILFAGLAAQQYGHVLTNSIGRLWALEHLPKETVLFFLPQRRPFAKLYPHVEPIVRGLGIKNKVYIAKAPHEFLHGYTATDIYGERFGGLGSREFFNWLDQRWWPKGPIKLGRSVYVSRTKLGPKVGRFACEDHLEKLLAKAGYEIYHPQEHAITHQVETFQNAERLIFAESSALHLYALVRRREQLAAVIQRRSELPELISRQLYARHGIPVERINAITAEYWPPIRQDNLSVGVLDFDSLRDGLMAAGLLSEKVEWSGPTKQDETQSLGSMLNPGEALMTAADREVFLAELRNAREAG